MGRSGQKNFIGTHFQTRAAFLYLLQSFNDPFFEYISIEEENWEDFTLHFSNYVIDFECKWWPSRNITTSDIRVIIQKEILKKQLQEKDRFMIVANQLSDEF